MATRAGATAAPEAMGSLQRLQLPSRVRAEVWHPKQVALRQIPHGKDAYPVSLSRLANVKRNRQATICLEGLGAGVVHDRNGREERPAGTVEKAKRESRNDLASEVRKVARESINIIDGDGRRQRAGIRSEQVNHTPCKRVARRSNQRRHFPKKRLASGARLECSERPSLPRHSVLDADACA